MARLSPPVRLPALARLMNLALRLRFGKPFPTVNLLSHHPLYPLPYLAMSLIYGNAPTRLDGQLKALVMQLVAQLNGCEFCIDLGKRMAQDNHMDVSKLEHVLNYAHDPQFTPRERTALQYAWEATQVGATVDDATYTQVRAHFSDREILELTVAVATENFYNRLTRPLEIGSKGFYRMYRDQA